MRTNATFSPESPKLDSKVDKIPLQEGFELLNVISAGPMNSALLAQLKQAETRLLQMERIGVGYVEGVVDVMVKDLDEKRPLGLGDLVNVLTNDEAFRIRA